MLQLTVCMNYNMCVLFLFIDLYRSVIFVFGYATLKILLGIKLPSLLASFLYLHLSVLLLVFVFSLTIIADCMLWKLKTFDLTTPNSSVDTSVSSVSWDVS